MRVTAVFQCTEKRPGGGGTHLSFTPPYAVDLLKGMAHDANLEAHQKRWKNVNEQWSQATPSGALSMLVTNPAAAEAFEQGGIYLLTFEPFPYEQFAERATPEVVPPPSDE